MKADRIFALLLVSTVVVSGFAGAVVGQQASVSGSPELDVHLPDPNVHPGQTNEVTIQISNDGELDYGPPSARATVTTARNVRVEANAEDTPLSVQTGETVIGPVTESKPGSATFALEIPDDVDSGTYEIEVDLTYSHTSQQTSSGATYDETKTSSFTITVEVDDDAQFSIVDTTTDVQVGDTGTLQAVVKNFGEDTARDINVALSSSSSGFTFGKSAQDSAHIDELGPGNETTVTYDVSVAPDTPVKAYTLDGTVQFKTSDGLQRVDESPSMGVTPRAEQRFRIDDVESTLYVGEEGDLYGNVTNEGPSEARNLVVQYTDTSPNLVAIERSVAVGTLAAGESASFRLPLEVNGEAEPVPRAIDLAVQYRNADFEKRRYDDLEVVADVAPQRDQFVLDVRSREIQAGDELTIDVEVTNNMNRTASNVEARLYADSPLDSSDDEAFAESLAPGESTTMRFQLSAESGAKTKTHPISFDFRYDDERGNSHLTDTTRVAIDVVQSEGGFPLFMLGGVLVVIGIAVGGYYTQRQ